MGVVYRARQLSLDREVAVKLLSAGPWASRDFVERFQREAQNAARMQHPNIVPIHEVGTIEGLHFFSMRLIRGTSLAAEVKRVGRLPALQAAQLLRVVAEAVDYAHRLGVLHLDLKPANVLMDESGEPHVADFGLARRLDQKHAADNTEVSGTPSYMAPEQATARSQKITPATDIWGLGAVLYELVTGVPPFLADTAQATLQLVVQGNLRNPRDLAADLPRDLEAIILKCMARESGERYASARELADDLGHFIEKRPVRARPLSAAQRALRWARREPRLAATATLAFLALMIGLVATTHQWRRADSNALRAENSAAETRITLWQARHAAAEVAIRADDGFASLTPLLDNVREQEQHAADTSADRLRIGLEFEHAPRLIDMLALDANPLDIAASPDGRRVAVLTLSHTSVTMLDPAAARVLWTQAVAPSEHLRFENDGRVLQVLADTNTGGWHWLRLRAEDGKPIPTQVPGEWKSDSYSLDGHYVLLGDDQSRVQLWDLYTGKALTEPRKVPTYGSLDLLGDGSVVWGGTDNGSVALLDPPLMKPRWSIAAPLGESVYFSDLSQNQRCAEFSMLSGRVDLLDISSGRLRTLPEPFSDRAGHMAFSEDGEWLAVGSRDRRAKIWGTADGNLLAPPIPHAGMVTTLALDRPARLLMSNDDGSPRLWRLADKPSRYAPVVPVGPRLMSRGVTTYNIQPLQLLPEQDLAITGGTAKELRFWRLPTDPMRRALAAPVAEIDMHFDGRHLVDVDGSSVRIVDAWKATPLAPPLRHPQPVSHAALSRDGETLWVAAGDELHRWDWRQGRARASALRLPNAVGHLALHPQRAEALVSILRYDSGRVYEDLFRVDDKTEQVLATTRLAGPLGGWRYSEDGAQVLIWRGDVLLRLDAATLAPASPMLRMGTGGGAYADARAHGGTLWTSVFNAPGDPQVTAVWRYEPGSTSPTLRGPGTGGVLVAALDAGGTQAVISPGGYPGHVPLQRFDIGGNHITLGERGDGGMAAAFSRDGRWLATALPDGIRLFDGTANPVGPPLRGALDFHDRIEQVAFADDEGSVLARSIKGRWLLWRLRADTRESTEIADELDSLLTPPGDERTSAGTDTAARMRLRGRDPGVAEQRPVSRTDPNLTPPPRAPDTPAQLLDLSAHFTRAAHEQNADDGSFDLRRLALGRQRIDGVEFDLRGVVQLTTPMPALNRVSLPPGLPREIHGIETPAQATALNLLMGYYGDDAEPAPCLSLVLHYLDGGERRIPVTLSIPPRWAPPGVKDDPLQGEESAAPLVLQVRSNNSEFQGGVPLRLYRVRVDNPEPMRALASVGLYAERNAPYVAAITADLPAPVSP
jgi:hypothetical protein